MTHSLFSPVVVAARAVAAVAHAGQFRRDGTTPYTKHTIDTASRGRDEDETIVGHLHDVLEDTNIREEQLRAAFPPYIVEAIVRLTKIEGQREEDYLGGLVGCPLAGRVKLHDMASNLADNPTEKQKERYKRMATYLIQNLPPREV